MRCCRLQHEVTFVHFVSIAVSPDVRGAYFGSLDRAFEGFSYVDESAGKNMLLAKGHEGKGAPAPQTVFNMAKKN